MTEQPLRDDIAFMRALAEEGGRPKGRGGLMVAGGLIYAAAAFASWSAAAGLWRPPGGAAGVNWVWLGASLLFAAVLIAVRLRQGGAATAGSKVAKAAWAGMGYAIWTICIGIGLIVWRTHDTGAIYVIAPMVVALYAGAWMVAGAVYAAPWARRVGFAALPASLGLALLAGQTVQLLAFGFAILAFTVLPGAYLSLRTKG